MFQRVKLALLGSNGRPVMAEIRELSELLAPAWTPMLAEARASGAVAAYDSVISRSNVAALVPEDVSNDMLKGITDTSFALTQFTRITVPQAQTRFPVMSALPVAYWVDGDTGLKQTSEMAWANKYLNVEEIAVIVPIPEAVLEDASYDIWGEVRPKLETAAARLFDQAVLFGTGAPASFPDDIVASATAASNTVNLGTNNAAAGGVGEDFNDVLAKTDLQGYDLDVFGASKRMKGHLRGARDADGNKQADVTVDRVQEIPVIYPASGLWPAAAGVIAAGIQKDQFVVGIRKDFTYKILDQAVIQNADGSIAFNLAQQDMVALRMVFRAGWQVANTINYDEPTEAERYPASLLLATS
jgi:HK97 family phage major capsid protein